MKDGKKPGKMIELTTSAQIAAWRQRLDTETKICQHKNHMEITKMQDQLDSKNTYMHLFKKDDIKERDELLEKSKTHVIYFFITLLLCSSFTTWPEATPSQTTARSASMRANGASIARSVKSPSRCSEPHSPRKNMKLVIFVKNSAVRLEAAN